MKNTWKEIGEAATDNSDMEFTKTTEGAMTFLRPFMMAGGDELTTPLLPGLAKRSLLFPTWT